MRGDGGAAHPIVKAFITDNGWISPPRTCMVFGGHGYIAEWGMEQFVRDARINMIYEGTNTIQSLDLLGRKVLGNQGATLKKLGAIMEDFRRKLRGRRAMGVHRPDAEGGRAVVHADLRDRWSGDEKPGSGRRRWQWTTCALLVTPVFAFWFAKMAKIALMKKDSGDPFYAAKLQTARFYFAKLLPKSRAARSRRAPDLKAADGDGAGAARSHLQPP